MGAAEGSTAQANAAVLEYCTGRIQRGSAPWGRKTHSPKTASRWRKSLGGVAQAPQCKERPARCQRKKLQNLSLRPRPSIQSSTAPPAARPTAGRLERETGFEPATLSLAR